METQQPDPSHKVVLQDKIYSLHNVPLREKCYKIHATVLTMSQPGKLISTMQSLNLFASSQTDQMLAGGPELGKYCFFICLYVFSITVHCEHLIPSPPTD